MKFADFEKIVLNKHPNAKLFKHGEFSGNKINVAVIFNGTNSEKVYQYNGTYCEVLNKLGIEAVYQHSVKAIEDRIKYCNRVHGTEDVFSDSIIDKTEEIAELTQRLNFIKENCVIV